VVWLTHGRRRATRREALASQDQRLRREFGAKEGDSRAGGAISLDLSRVPLSGTAAKAANNFRSRQCQVRSSFSGKDKMLDEFDMAHRWATSSSSEGDVIVYHKQRPGGCGGGQPWGCLLSHCKPRTLVAAGAGGHRRPRGREGGRVGGHGRQVEDVWRGVGVQRA
jgi:hypothetical protein